MTSSSTADPESNRWIAWSRGRVTDWPASKSIPEIFAHWVQAAPDATAVVDGAESWSYSELDQRADRVARTLISRGLAPGDFVSVPGVRSAAFVATALGVLKAGGAYIPLDPDEPAERRELRRRDCALIWDNADADATTEVPAPIRATPESPAYVLYTSGSTGTPKGVVVPHRAIVRLVCATDYIDIQPSDVFAFHSNLSFDASTLELWAPLLNGASLVVTATETVLSAPALAAHLRAHRVTALWLTTSLFNQLVLDSPAMFASLRWLIFGGEAADVASVRRVLENGRPGVLLNGYGPTECTTFAVCHRIENVNGGRVPIGRPIANTDAIILDADMQPAAEGELHIGGPGVALGYLHAPAFTAQRFIETEYGRLYKTGDLARWLDDGTIDYLGRIDRQIKLRGFRIEPGEIEAALRLHPGVQMCVVTVRSPAPGRELLTAYFVGDTTGDALRGFLRDKLPAQMLPGAFVRLDALPLTPNGKLDYHALPEPDERLELRAGFVAPQKPLELRIAAVWQYVLGLAAVGIDDNFFDIGGTSLLMIRVHSQLSASFTSLAIVTLFQHPTIRSLAEHLDAPRDCTPHPAASAQDRAAKLRQSLAQRRLFSNR